MSEKKKKRQIEGEKKKHATAIKYARGEGGENEDNEGWETSDAAAAGCYRNPDPHQQQHHPTHPPLWVQTPSSTRLCGSWGAGSQDHRIQADQGLVTCVPVCC